MTPVVTPPASPLPAEPGPPGLDRAQPLPHQSAPDDLAAWLGVDPATGLSAAEAARRLDEIGPNRLADVKKRPAWLVFLDQFREFLILILLAAAVLSFAVERELKTPIVIGIVVVFNAVLGYVQGNRAEKSLDALKRMLVTSAKVRRDGRIEQITSEHLVPGDVVLVEAGDRVPADGRLTFANSLEIEEAALTGESQPVAKSIDPIEAADASLGDRHNVVYMNTTVTRGRGELLVTGTGMTTEIGKIAGLLRATESDKTPLEKQLAGLAHTLAKLAGVIVVLVFAIGLLRGDDVGDLLVRAIALAVASIPEGLPAVTAITLAVGVFKMAKKNAIVKRLASVETLGSTSVICSDKTGTLTLNQMTAQELWFQTHRHEITGDGYSTEGTISRARGDNPTALDDVLMPMALCNDAVVRGGELVGDPTEGALVVLAEKGGIDVLDLRERFPRIDEVPFDSSNKFMATFHRMPNDEGRIVVRAYVKGAPDVLLARSATVIGSDGAAVPMSVLQSDVLAENDRLADQGLRVLAVAQREFPEETFDEFVADGGQVLDLVEDLTLIGLAGIVDPPRAEARDAIAEANAAGISVKMITGDHAATAAAIGRELGLRGSAVTGADLDRMSDEELEARIDDISVFARVAPEHKMKLVGVLQKRGNVVAMTGDGVNDAPALKKADMGVAMGITGTEVTKEAATMVLTDDNFATIVRAVRQGRTIYDNIVKFVRFQLSTTIGFAITFLASSLFNISNSKPFTAIQILWVNIIMDGPPAMALGVDPPESDIMRRTPRPLTEKILTPRRTSKIVFRATIMAAGSLALLAFGPGPAPEAGVPTVAGTMAFATFILFQFFNILNARNEHRTVFRRDTFHNGKLWASLIAVVVLQVAVTHVHVLQGWFDTTDLTIGQWLVCVAVASSVLWLEELRKLAARRFLPAPSH